MLYNNSSESLAAYCHILAWDVFQMYRLVEAFWRVLRLRIIDPRVSRCMLVSIIVVILTATPLAQLRNRESVSRWLTYPQSAAIVIHHFVEQGQVRSATLSER